MADETVDGALIVILSKNKKLKIQDDSGVAVMIIDRHGNIIAKGNVMQTSQAVIDAAV